MTDEPGGAAPRDGSTPPRDPVPGPPDPPVDEATAGPRAAGDPPGGRPSGLRNPAGAMRSLGAATLVLEAVVLLLAIQPIRLLGGRLGGTGIAIVVALAVLAVVIAGLMRRRWAWYAGTALQVGVLLAGFVHWSLAAVGVLFAVVWAYATSVRRTVLG